MQMRAREDELRLARLENAEMRAKQDLDVAKMRHLEARLRCLEETISSGSGGGGLFLTSGGGGASSSPTAAPASSSSSSSSPPNVVSVAGAPHASGNLLVCTCARSCDLWLSQRAPRHSRQSRVVRNRNEQEQTGIHIFVFKYSYSHSHFYCLVCVALRCARFLFSPN